MRSANEVPSSDVWLKNPSLAIASRWASDERSRPVARVIGRTPSASRTPLISATTAASSASPATGPAAAGTTPSASRATRPSTATAARTTCMRATTTPAAGLLLLTGGRVYARERWSRRRNGATGVGRPVCDDGANGAGEPCWGRAQIAADQPAAAETTGGRLLGRRGRGARARGRLASISAVTTRPRRVCSLSGALDWRPRGADDVTGTNRMSALLHQDQAGARAPGVPASLRSAGFASAWPPTRSSASPGATARRPRRGQRRCPAGEAPGRRASGVGGRRGRLRRGRP